MTADTLLSDLDRDGFVIVRQIVKGDDLKRLQEAAIRTADTARAGGWPHVRIVGKQFPPWAQWDPEAAAQAKATQGKAQKGIWGVQHIMKPDLGPDAALFLQSYFAEGGPLDVAKRLLRCADDDLVMELYNMFVRPDYEDYNLRWHRDDIPPEASDADELARLAQPAYHAQWNLALWDDQSLVAVPGSHKRARTPAERAADPWAPQLPPEPEPRPPGYRPQLTVALGPGDIVFYNNNILHRGVYDARVERTTLHGSVGHVHGSRLRARNVLQHGIGDWVHRLDFGPLTPAERRRAEGMRDRLVRLGMETGPVGYSLQG